jgi:hypothetical protein
MAQVHSLVGVLFFAGGVAMKDTLPNGLGSSPWIQFPADFFSAVFLPLGAFFALLALINQQGSRRKMTGYYLSCMVPLLLMLAGIFYAYFAWTRLLLLPLQNRSEVEILAELIQQAHTMPVEEKRIQQARWAYRLFGVTLSYRQDNGALADFIPSSEDEAAWNRQRKFTARSQRFIKQLNAAYDEFPYLFGLYLGTSFATLLAGGAWFLIRNPSHPD